MHARKLHHLPWKLALIHTGFGGRGWRGSRGCRSHFWKPGGGRLNAAPREPALRRFHWITPATRTPFETQEWLGSLDGVIEFEGPERAHYVLHRVMDGARRKGAPIPTRPIRRYLNTIPVEKQAPHPGDRAIEHRIRSVIRWNALAIVLRANKTSSELGGHIASFQSSALLYDRPPAPHPLRNHRYGSRAI